MVDAAVWGKDGATEMRRTLLALYEWRYRRWWRKWRGNPCGQFPPSPFVMVREDVYLIAKRIQNDD